MKLLLPVIFFFLLTAQTCRKDQTKVTPAIFRHWIHSFEEDTPGLQTYRPSSYNFPLARGREGFEIKENGTFIRYRTGPADGTEKVEGSWKTVSKNTIQVKFATSDMAPYAIQLIQVNDSLLTLKKISK